MSQQIEAVFENGVFRPLEPVALRERQRVTLQLSETGEADVAAPAESTADSENVLPEEEQWDEEITYEPLPPDQVKTIRVQFHFVGKGEPLPYPLDDDELEALNELE